MPKFAYLRTNAKLRMMKYLAYSFFVAILVISCESSIISTDQEIILGDTEGMIISMLNVEINSADLKSDSLLIDVDNDGEEDMMIESTWCLYGGGAGDCSGIRIIRLLESLELGGIIRIDTSYERIETQRDTFLESDSIKIVQTVYSSCKNSHEDFEIYHIMEPLFHLKAFSIGDEIDNNVVFAKEDYYFRNVRTQGRSGFCSQVGENSYQTVNEYFDRTCYNLPETVEWYIPFRMERRQNNRLGWIKVQYNGYSTIKIIEFAIQE